ncbi:MULTISPECIES: hypothetical protein [unclassified Brevundimonas]|uniref:hypothetical protein n=1 Tax=unclassified Brevundimonas TaxID=2622653 RepID=UPI0025C6194C|nr:MULTISPECIES: hypothetical protein [unclassified Brevundimonas]
MATSNADALPTGVRVYNAFYPLHASSVGGWLYGAVTALSGVAMAGLGGVGAWAYLGKPDAARLGPDRPAEDGRKNMRACPIPALP